MLIEPYEVGPLRFSTYNLYRVKIFRMCKNVIYFCYLTAIKSLVNPKRPKVLQFSIKQDFNKQYTLVFTYSQVLGKMKYLNSIEHLRNSNAVV